MTSVQTAKCQITQPISGVLLLVIFCCQTAPVFPQSATLKSKLQEYFFDLPFGVDIDVIKTELANSPDFKLSYDPNRDARKTIVGTFKTDKNLNPAATYNQ